MNADQYPPRLHDKHEAATLLKVTVSWLERKAAARQIPFTMLGGTYKFTDEHLTQIVALFEESPAATTDTAHMTSASGSRTARRPIARTRRVQLLTPRPKRTSAA